MIDLLYSIDVAVFHFINNTLSNPVGDVLWPLITDYDKLWPVRIVLLATWVVLVTKGGRTGRTAAIMIIPVLFLSDKFSSEIIKEMIDRARPCHDIGGTPVVQGIHLLVSCGPGKSFPSSHAVNNFAVATVFAFCYPQWKLWFLGWASLVALSRPAVGVHYPSDILFGALVGSLLALVVIWLWLTIEKHILPKESAKGD
ncbi:MAG: phosphatase PAP2 family protein [Ignavibacteriae bacterium]|nr:phosphatase PAP2 family protein [Ignavibacteriota bacterium]